MIRDDKFNLLTKILEINETLEKGFFSLKFIDEKLEKEYSGFIVKDVISAKLVIHIFFLLFVFKRVFFWDIPKSNSIDSFISPITLCITVSLSIICIFVNNLYYKKIIYIIFSIIIQIANAYSVIIMFYSSKMKIEGGQIRGVYTMLIFCFLEITFSFEINFLNYLFYLLVNVGTILYINIMTLERDKYNYYDTILSILILLVCYILKRFTSILKRENFIQNHKLSKFFSYSYDLINSMNGMQLTIKDNKIMLYNELYKKYILESKIIKNLDINKLYKNNIINNEIVPYFEKRKDVNIREEKNNIENSNITNKNIIPQEIIERFKKLNELPVKNLKNNLETNLKIDENKNKDNKTNLQKKINKYFCKIFSKKKKKEINLNVKNIIDFNSSVQDNFLKDKNYNLNNKNSLKINESANELNPENEQIKIQKISCLDNNENDYNQNQLLNANGINLNINNQDIFNFFEPNFDYFINEIGEYHFSNFKKEILNKEFINYDAENLFHIYQKIKFFYNEKNIIETFTYLGDFSLEEDKKYFQVYFRKNSNFNDLFDFLVYDITKIKEYKNTEFDLKSKSFTKAVHEFKTPINSIIGLIKNLNNYDIEKKENHKEIKRTHNQIENLSQYVIFLITDIIDNSSLNSSNQEMSVDNNQLTQKMNLKIENVNLKEITIFCNNITKTLIVNKSKEKYIKIINDYDDLIDLFEIISDEFRLKQILLNFISNSVKFTKCGMIKIKSEILPIKDDNEYKQFTKILNNEESIQIKISIIDSGIGIKQNELKSLLEFKDNNMLKSGNNYNQEGSGLGISITKNISDLLDHQIIIDSTYGKGSCFSIVIKGNLKNTIISERDKNKLKNILNNKKNYNLKNNENNIISLNINEDKSENYFNFQRNTKTKNKNLNEKQSTIFRNSSLFSKMKNEKQKSQKNSLIIPNIDLIKNDLDINFKNKNLDYKRSKYSFFPTKSKSNHDLTCYNLKDNDLKQQKSIETITNRINIESNNSIDDSGI